MTAAMPHIDDSDPRCFTCQIEPAIRAKTATTQERNHWFLWGCTCDPEDAAGVESAVAEALAYMRRVTD